MRTESRFRWAWTIRVLSALPQGTMESCHCLHRMLCQIYGREFDQLRWNHACEDSESLLNWNRDEKDHLSYLRRWLVTGNATKDSHSTYFSSAQYTDVKTFEDRVVTNRTFAFCLKDPNEESLNRNALGIVIAIMNAAANTRRTTYKRLEAGCEVKHACFHWLN